MTILIFNKVKKYSIVALILFFNSAALGQYPVLDLAQSEQQKDFLQYLTLTTSLLRDKSLKEMMKGYKLDSLSDRNKQEIAVKIMKDSAFFKKLYNYFGFLKTFEDKYKISRFTHDEWKEIAEFGAKHGIYYIERMKDLKERRDTLPAIPFNFPIVPLVKDTSILR
ncbi:MAG: hypothetical protein IT214_08565 [Chitinophagaceae bacterium]|nr:hypothetical protein [Chitinophagaceae bacterium]